jgi:serine/threonine protein kinase
LALTPGTRLGVYEITALIGEGGMGQVYRATDTRLKRQVAIKILPQALAADHDRRARSQREAEVLASLNHPHIAAIYGLEETGGTTALVMELVEGDDLSQRIARGAIPLDEALPIAKQIAEALEAAHERGIVHRDLKPANIKIAPGGVVKVLDFGLAKAMAAVANEETETTDTGAMTAHGTREGLVLGTPAYMSPEQARGQAVDKRTDIWAFGCVLYEMVTGEHAFPGATVSDTIAAILHREPDWTTLPPNLPASVRRVLERCLSKDLRKRLRDIGDARVDLDESLAPPSTTGPAGARQSRPGAVRWTAGLFATSAIAIAAALAGARFSSRPAGVSHATAVPQPTVRLTLVPPVDRPLWLSEADRDFVISRDGTRLVYVSGSDRELMTRAIDRLDAVRLGNVTGARSPFISPDGKWVGFFVGVSNTEVKKISMTGGPAMSLGRAPGGARGGAWGQDDTIVFATQVGKLLRVPASGGEITVLSTPDSARGETGHLFPSFLPGGQTILLTVTHVGDPLDNGQIVALDLKTGRRTLLLSGGSQPEYVEAGYLVYGVAGALRAVRFNAATLDVMGEPVSVVNDVATIATTGAGEFSLSASGVLVYLPGGTLGAARSLVWVDRQGHEEPVSAPPRMYAYARISPDGSRVALELRDQERDLWTWDFMRQTLTRLTTHPALDMGAVWTTGGQRVIFTSQRLESHGDLFWQQADGTANAERLTTSVGQPVSAMSMLPGGTRLVVRSGSRLGVLGIDRNESSAERVPRQIEPLAGAPFEVVRASVSPNGHWLAYESRAETPQIYVRPFPNVDKGSWQISIDGGTQPVWAARGDELFYRDAKGAMVAVHVRTSPTFSADRPERLFTRRYVAGGTAGWNYDVGLDGRFLMIKDPQADRASTSLVVIWNWADELRRLVPVK